MPFKQGKPTEQELCSFAHHIITFWRRFGLALKLEQYTLDEIEEDYSKVHEKSYQMLLQWSRSNGPQATYRKLAEALADPIIDRNDLVYLCCMDMNEAVPFEDKAVESDETENVCSEMKNLTLLKVDEKSFPRMIPSVNILLGEPFHKTFERNKELQTIQNLFTSLDNDNTSDDVTMVYVTGPPGSGKTQLSRQFSKWFGLRSHPNMPRSIVVSTLHAETPESLLESYRQLTCALGIEVDDDGKHDDIKKKLKLYSDTVKNLFQKSKLYNFEWLVVVDNVFASNPLKEYWPLPGSGWGYGRVIVTTQDAQLAPSAHTHSRTLSLSRGMESEDAIQFLCHIADLERDDLCAEIAQKLNYYPLSLACAAVFVRDMRNERPAAKFSWKNYLENLEKYFELMKYSVFTDHNICYPQSMLSAVVCSASRMASTNRVLKCAFKFLSYCTIQPIPLDVVSEAVLKNIEDEALIPDEVKRTLARCSLLSYPRDGVRGIEVVTMHQVMRAAFVHLRREFCKNFSEAEGTPVHVVERRNFVETLSTICEYYHRFKVIQEHAISTRILLSPHLQDFIATANKENFTQNEAFIDGSVCFADSLVQVCGGTDYQRVQLLENARKIQKDLNLKNLCACRLLSDLAYSYREAGRLHEVPPILEEANIIADNHNGMEWLKQRSQILNVLGWTYRETYQLELASGYMSMSIEVTKKAYGDQHAEVIERLCNYGIILNDRWRNQEAVKVMEEAQAIVEAVGIDTQSAVRAQVLNYSAKIYLRWFLGLSYSEGLTERAKSFLCISKHLHEQALDIYGKLNGKDHKFYLGTAMTYATVLCHLGEPDLAQEYCEEALRVYRSSGHLAWPRVAGILADIYLEKAMFTEAKDLLEEAIQGLIDFGVDMSNPRVWLQRARLAEAVINIGERERGIAILRRCIDAYEENGVHPEHYWVLRAREVLETSTI